MNAANETDLTNWPRTVAEARRVQEALRGRVVMTDRFGKVKHVAGVDVGFEAAGALTRAAVVVLSFPELKPVERVIARMPTCFPYVPGYLSFREIPAVRAALKKLGTRPDLLLCDGQGLAHPRRFGLACHLGVLTDTPSIGVAKSLLIGAHGRLARPRGSWTVLTDGAETPGAVVRTRAGVKPVYVSIGHRISLETAIDYVLRCTPMYRLPETTRAAHRLASS